MDCFPPAQPDQGVPAATAFTRQSSIEHLCNHTCQVVHQFGNVFQCQSSGLLHVCDSQCSSRVWRDRYSSICLISRRIHGPLPEHHAQAYVQRKRVQACCQGEEDQSDACKRMNSMNSCGAPVA